MKKTSTMSNRCQECVFFRRRCVLGHRRPWNAASCDDYRPYCLICRYPSVYCHTCRIMASQRLRPLTFDRDVRLARRVDFECV